MEKTNTIVTYDIGRKTGKRPCIPMKYMASVGVLLLQPPQRCQAAELAQNNQRHLQFLFSNQNPPSKHFMHHPERDQKHGENNAFWRATSSSGYVFWENTKFIYICVGT